MECTQWVVTVAPPPLGFFYKPVCPLRPNCFRYVYHVNDSCVEGFPNQILLMISILIHRHLFNVNILWLSLILLSLLFKRRRENVLDHTMMTWVFYQSHLLSKARKQAWEKKLPFWISVGSWAKTNDNLAAAWNTSRLVFWSAGSSYAFSQVRSTDYCLCKVHAENTLFPKFVNLGCCTSILPMMILLPGNKGLVSSTTTFSIVSRPSKWLPPTCIFKSI